MSTSEWEMFEGEVFPIHNPVDIIALRMGVRQIARQAGLGLVGQSSLSIATSNLAYKMGLDTHTGGRVKVGQQRDGTRVGVRLVMSMPVKPNEKPAPNLSDEVYLLVDKIDIHINSENIMIITMMKWELNEMVNNQTVEQ